MSKLFFLVYVFAYLLIGLFVIDAILLVLKKETMIGRAYRKVS